jgi:hypothetical protein
MQQLVESEYHFLPTERPLIPGSAATPEHPFKRKVGYVLIAMLLVLTGNFGNAMVTVHVPNLSGALGGYVTEISWFPAIFVAFAVTANLALVKARIQFGLAKATSALLITYATAAAISLLLPGFASFALVRAASGLASAMMTALILYNLMQVFPAKIRPKALVTGLGLQQMGVPLARLVPVEMLALNHSRSLHLMEIALALGTLAAITALPLPQAERERVFEPLDFVTFALVLPAMVLICGVINQGRLVWWFDTPWLGWALVAAIPLLAAAFLIEHRRARPLLQVGWIGSTELLRFIAVALLVRLALAEQTYGAVGLLTSGGLTNDQLHTLFALVSIAMLAGTVTAALVLTEPRLRYMIASAALLIALGSFIEGGATNLTRPPQLYLSEMLIGFGTTLFIGPALVFGFLRMLAHGPSYLITFVVFFNMTQNLGGLVGSALLGSYQVRQTHAHAETIFERIRADDPQVVTRLQKNAGAISGVVADPRLQNVEGDSILANRVNAEATVLAYNDVSMLVALMALLTAGYVLYLMGLDNLKQLLAMRGAGT